MVRQGRALSPRFWALLVGIAGWAAAFPAYGQLASPATPALNNGTFTPASLSSPAACLANDDASGVTLTNCSSCGCCCAQECCPWYVSVSGGFSSRDTVHEVGDPATFLVFDDGFALNAALGHQFGMFRADFEYSYFNNDVQTAGAGVPGVGNFVGDAVGNVTVKAYTLNGYFDYPLWGSRFKPYIGGGVGLMQSEINSLFPSFFPALGAGTGGVNTTSDVKFCYQFRAGLSYELTCRTDVFAGYRFFDAGELTFAGEPFGVFHPDGATFHNIEGGLRVKF